MSQNKLKDLAGLHFVEFKHLRTLKLNYNFLQKLDYISHLTMLQELEVSNNKIRSINPYNQIQQFPQMPSLTKLKRVFLGHNKFSDFSQIEPLFFIPTIREIQFSGNPICLMRNYSSFIVENIVNLKVLDGEILSKREEDIFEDYQQQFNQKNMIQKPVNPSYGQEKRKRQYKQIQFSHAQSQSPQYRNSQNKQFRFASPAQRGVQYQKPQLPPKKVSHFPGSFNQQQKLFSRGFSGQQKLSRHKGGKPKVNLNQFMMQFTQPKPPYM